ncbi:oxidoreductase/Short-chain dehydrogenase [Cystobacter fuscus]|uniref:Oxidoreductase/Short-chain dehydrogenase n=1 Tax=Cystobacter fuscus TaxID=43 RepID=A0A250IS95_9BACT|nr:SDR family oxidoreductase [Cystobacter fuscus]ATB34635.1 oxidoreductase/Short-chain dehydrogenase [Cystobacter fuscus]
MKNKTVIVTGANSGVGLATTVELARRGATVVMACRSAERGEAALKLARERSGSHQLELLPCDLGSLESIRAFASAARERHPVVDVLVNNAGVVSLKRETTRDGFEAQLGVNHLGHFLLTLLLLEPLKRAPQGRVVTVSSGAHRVGNIHWADPHFTRGYSVWRGYAQSKLANVLFTKGLAYRLRGTSVTANCLHPGAVGTQLGVDRDTGGGRAIMKLLSYVFITPEQGADTSVYLASSDEVSGVSGEYFYRRKPAPVSKLAEDREQIERLWFWSEKQVGELFPFP